MKVISVVGARPNFMKVAPLQRCMVARGFEHRLVHTGQHHDDNMSRCFFEDLGMPKPDVFMGIGSGTHAQQTARVMLAFEQECLAVRPDLVVVVGDVNSTLAGALVAAKLGIPVAHVEAGLRSNDRTMPEEINRVVTDHLAEILFTPSPDGDENLRAEGIPGERIHFVGNIMIDTLFEHLPRARQSSILTKLGVQEGAYAVATLHRPSNVDEPDTLARLMRALVDLSSRLPVIFVCHPRTAQRLQGLGGDGLSRSGALRLVEPLGYLDFLCLSSSARLVLTDSGGLQEETTALGIPCITMRENTERPITVSQGTNTVVGTEPERIQKAVEVALAPTRPRQRLPPRWDGHTAPRVVDVLERWWRDRPRR